MATENLLETIRKSATTESWSKGIQFNRAGFVLFENRSADEFKFRVNELKRAVSASVVLWPKEDDWNCDCSEKSDPCCHVVAAGLTLKEQLNGSSSSDTTMVNGKNAPGLITYHLSRKLGSLSFTRKIATSEGNFEPLKYTLTALKSGRIKGPKVAPTSLDFEIETILGYDLDGVPPVGKMVKIFSRLMDSGQVYLDGVKTNLAPGKVGYKVFIEDCGGGYKIVGRIEGRIDEVFQNGLALCQNTLHLIDHTSLSREQKAVLSKGQIFGQREKQTLVTEIIPKLEKLCPVVILTTKLPQSETTPPRLIIKNERLGDNLVVEASIVYGDSGYAKLSGEELIIDEGFAPPVRNREAELRLKDLARRQLGLRYNERLILEPHDAIEFSKKLKRWEGTIEGEAFEDFFLAPRLVPKIQVSDNDLDVVFHCPDPFFNDDEGRITIEQAMKAYDRYQELGQESLIALKGGGFAPLPEDWLKQYGDKVRALFEAKIDLGSGEDDASEKKLPPSLYPEAIKICRELDYDVPKAMKPFAKLLDGVSELPETKIPKDFKATLRDYQKVGVDWLNFHWHLKTGALLADDMGLGKTVQAIATLTKKTLIVAPASVIYNWQKEIEKFRPSFSVNLYHGSSRKLDLSYDVTITTYGLLRMDQMALKKVDWEMVILDEAQMIKNPESQVSQAAYKIDAKRKLALSGTPIENRISELWSQFRFINPGLLGTRRNFLDRYQKGISYGEEEVVKRLRQTISPFILRRKKEDVLKDLPQKTEMLLYCELSREEQEQYDAILAATRKDVAERFENGGNMIEVLEALLRLRQSACHMGLIPGGEGALDSAKLSLLMETLEDLIPAGHKALVFSQWTSLLDLTEPHLKDRDINFLRLDGASRKRQDIVDNFQNDENIKVMLISLKAGGVGLNLTAADHIFLLDPWWNPAVEAQAADRAHRYGQTRPVFVHRLVAKNTVDESIIKLQEKKRNIAEAALSGALSTSKGLTKEDILELIG